MNRTDQAPDDGRRRFLMMMGLACATTAIAQPAAVLARTAQPGADSTAATPPAPATPTAEALALAEVIRLRFGKDVTPAKLGVIAKDLDARLEGGRDLRDLRLTNGQEPDFIFHA